MGERDIHISFSSLKDKTEILGILQDHGHGWSLSAGGTQVLVDVEGARCLVEHPPSWGVLGLKELVRRRDERGSDRRGTS